MVHDEVTTQPSGNLDVVRSIFGTWERGDFSSADWADPDIEWAAFGGPEPSSGKGIASLARNMGGFLDAWAEYRVKADEYRQLDGERVLVLQTASARGRASGLEARGGTSGATLLHLRDGKVTRLVAYWDRHHALADLGLKE